MRQYLLIPVNPEEFNDRIFLGPYRFLQTALAARGIQLHTYDRGDASQAEKIICFNHRRATYNALRKLGVQKRQLVLLLQEPQSVIPNQYTSRTLQKYEIIFTYLDNLVDNRHIFKMRYPQGQTILDSVPGFAERKFLMLMNANKYSYVKNELYSLRRRAISYFEHAKDFDLYGYGWNRNGTLTFGVIFQALQKGRIFQYAKDFFTGFHRPSCYRGSVPDKYAICQQYKFSLTFENEAETLGWISEKLFDCLVSGTVPVYVGAKNVDVYIPTSCFIDFRKFKDFSQLNAHLRSMSESEFAGYQRSGQDFLRSTAFKDWQPAQVFEAMTKQLMQ